MGSDVFGAPGLVYPDMACHFRFASRIMLISRLIIEHMHLPKARERKIVIILLGYWCIRSPVRRGMLVVRQPLPTYEVDGNAMSTSLMVYGVLSMRPS